MQTMSGAQFSESGAQHEVWFALESEFNGYSLVLVPDLLDEIQNKPLVGECEWKRERLTPNKTRMIRRSLVRFSSSRPGSHLCVAE